MMHTTFTTHDGTALPLPASEGERLVPRFPPAVAASPPRPVLIGLTGLAGAGKTTAANFLEREFGFVRPHIGLPLKNMLRSLLRDAGVPADLIERYVDGDLKREVIPELAVTSTYAQQTLGTEWGRDCIRADLWLGLWLGRVDKILAAGGRVAQESVRFPNEAAEIQKRGGLLIRIVGRGGIEGAHESETHLLPTDVVVENSGTVSEFEARIRFVVGALCSGDGSGGRSGVVH